MDTITGTELRRRYLRLLACALQLEAAAGRAAGPHFSSLSNHVLEECIPSRDLALEWRAQKVSTCHAVGD